MSEHSTLSPPQPAIIPGMPGRRWTRHPLRRAGLFAAVVLAAGATALGLRLASVVGGSSPVPTPVESTTEPPADAKAASAWQRTAVSEAGLAERSGVRIVQVALTGGGGLVDLRFQVLDPDKAQAVHGKATPPAIVDGATGLVVKDLFMGHAHKAAFHPAQTYYLIFENPGNLVRRGTEVSVLLGDAQVDHVVIQ